MDVDPGFAGEWLEGPSLVTGQPTLVFLAGAWQAAVDRVAESWAQLM